MAYIDKDLLLKEIGESVVFTVRNAETSPELRGARKIIDRIKNAPATDVVEVKHGYWENMGEYFANCSNCGTIFEALPTMFAFKSNNIFCRHCGTRMDGTPKERGGEK